MSNARSPVGPQRRPIDVFPWRRASCRRDGRQLLRDWLMLALLSILVFAFPVRTTITREAAILLGVLTWISGMILFRRSAGAWAVSIALAAGIAWVALAPGKAINGNALQAQYVMCLKTYRGTRYVWGGENCLGIDCSGLVRQGMIMATLREGLATGNPGLVRESVFIWYHDCTAPYSRDTR